MRERDIERYLRRRVREAGGAVRKVRWIGRKHAPDDLVMLPGHPGTRYLKNNVPARPAKTVWVEVKNPDTVRTFPANAHERAQHREHQLMRGLGQTVAVVGTFDQVEELLR